jgi:hypothetical protein
MVMKKRTTKKSVKKKSNVSKCKPFFDNKKLVAIAITTFLVFAFLLAFTNVPQQNATITGEGIKGLEKLDTSGVGTFLENIMDPVKADETVAKWIMFFSLILGMLGILHMLKIKNAFLAILTIPLSYATVYFLKLSEIMTGLLHYGAIGFAIFLGAPFIGILFGALWLLEKRRSPTRIILQLVAWIIYLICLFYFIITRVVATSELYDLGVLILLLGFTILTLIIIIKNKKLRDWISKLQRESDEKAIEDTQHILKIKEKGDIERAELAKKGIHQFKETKKY